MDMSSGEMMTTASSASSKQKCVDVKVGEGKGRWINSNLQDLITLNLTPVDAEDRDE